MYIKPQIIFQGQLLSVWIPVRSCSSANSLSFLNLTKELDDNQERTRHNISLNPTGMSLPLIVNLSHDVVVSRRVNSGVRLPT